MLALAAGSLASASYDITNTAYVNCTNGQGVAQPPRLSATTFTVTSGAPPVITVATPVRLLVEIYDETGRLVRTVEDRHVPTALTVVRVGDGSGRASPSAGQPVVITLSDGSTAVWDVRDTSGGLAPNGAYTVRVASFGPAAPGSPAAGAVESSSATFTLTRVYGKLIVSARLVPNPASDVAWISFALASASATFTIKVYDVTGVLVHVGTAPGTARSYRWPLRNQQGTQVADGMYAVVLEAYDPVTGDRQREVRKLAVARTK